MKSFSTAIRLVRVVRLCAMAIRRVGLPWTIDDSIACNGLPLTFSQKDALAALIWIYLFIQVYLASLLSRQALVWGACWSNRPSQVVSSFTRSMFSNLFRIRCLDLWVPGCTVDTIAEIRKAHDAFGNLSILMLKPDWPMCSTSNVTVSNWVVADVSRTRKCNHAVTDRCAVWVFWVVLLPWTRSVVCEKFGSFALWTEAEVST